VNMNDHNINSQPRNTESCNNFVPGPPPQKGKESLVHFALKERGGQTWESMPLKRPNQLRLLDTFLTLQWQAAMKLMLSTMTSLRLELCIKVTGTR